MGFSRQEHWGGLPFPTPGDLPDPGIKPPSLVSPALAGAFFTTSATWTLELVSDLKGSSRLLGQLDYRGLRDGGTNLSH